MLIIENKFSKPGVLYFEKKITPRRLDKSMFKIKLLLKQIVF